MKAAGIIEDEADHGWEAKLKQLRGNKERSGVCNVLFTDAELRGWSVQQGEMFQITVAVVVVIIMMANTQQM